MTSKDSDRPRVRATVIAIGDELVTGRRLDTNSAFISDALTLRGVDVVEHVCVGDDLDQLVACIDRAVGRSDLVISTGGLGPTKDDLTREALARATRDELVVDAKAVSHINAYFEQRGRTPPPTVTAQALRPSRARILANTRGTAPGLEIDSPEGAAVIALPGPPIEMRPMLQHAIETRLSGSSETHVRLIHTFGMGESVIAERLGDLMDRGRDPAVGTNASSGSVVIRVRSARNNGADLVTRDVDTITARLGSSVVLAVGSEEISMAAAVADALRARGLRLATAESCTGGLVGAAITGEPGASDVFAGGVVAYSNDLKRTLLGVSAESLERDGAVSERVAREMADGARRATGACVAVSVTGIAGPSGGTQEKPVGTVWFGVASEGQPTAARQFRFGGGRESVREWAVHTALGVVWQRLAGVATATLGEVIG